MTAIERIDAAIKERGLSRRELAIKAGIPPSDFQNAMEWNDTWDYSMLTKVAAALDMRLSDFTSLISGGVKMRRDDVSGYCTEINGVKYTGWFGESSDNFPSRILKPLKLVPPDEFIAMFGDPTEDIPSYPPEIAALAEAVEPLHDYMLKYGDPHTKVTVTQYGARLETEEISIPFVKSGKSDRSAEFEREIKEIVEGVER